MSSRTFRFQVALSFAGEGLRGAIMDSAMGMTLEGSETVLVVDDELFIVTMAHDILTRHGYRVLGASSGPEALHLFKSWPDLKIDLALLDIVMPVITGPELAVELQKIRPKLAGRIHICLSGNRRAPSPAGAAPSVRGEAVYVHKTT